MINEGLYHVVKELCYELIAEFEREGTDVCANGFLSQFSYYFLTHEQTEREKRVLDAALVAAHRAQAEKAVEAAYSDHGGGTFEFYVAYAVQDFLNFILPRIIALPDRDAVFDHYYAQFDQSFYGDTCTVTTFAILSNIWDNGLRAVLPPSFLLRYYTKMPGDRSPDRWTRDRIVPYFEIAGAAHPIGLGRSISEESSYFVFSHSRELPKDKKLIPAAYALRDEITRKFIFAVRLLKFGATYADYRGFRTIGHLAMYQLNLMNFHEEVIEGGQDSEFTEYDGHRLRVLMPKLASEPYDAIAILDTKIEDALRRRRQGAGQDQAVAMRLAIDQLLDYFQILEALVPAMGSEFIALYAAVLLHGIRPQEDAESAYDFVKRMHTIRNEVMHGRLQLVLTSIKNKLTEHDIRRFREIIHALAGAYVMNGALRDKARLLALGKKITLVPAYPESTEEMNAMRKPQSHPAAWW
jgi:hypothetical protein